MNRIDNYILVKYNKPYKYYIICDDSGTHLIYDNGDGSIYYCQKISDELMSCEIVGIYSEVNDSMKNLINDMFIVIDDCLIIRVLYQQTVYKIRNISNNKYFSQTNTSNTNITTAIWSEYGKNWNNVKDIQNIIDVYKRRRDGSYEYFTKYCQIVRFGMTEQEIMNHE